VTGGHGGLISKFLKRRHNLMHELTLHGLKIIYTKNKNA
jgi:hypothetical protein